MATRPVLHDARPVYVLPQPDEVRGMTDLEFGRPLRGEAAEVLWERIESRVQSRPKRCTAQLFAGPEYRCHRDAGHADAHIHYNEHNDGLAGWRNEATE